MPCARSRSSWMVLQIPGQLVQHLAGRLRLVGEHVPGQPQAHRERDEVLLGAVVQVALQPAPLRVAAGHDAGARLAQRLGLGAQLVERALQGRVQLRVVEREADLAGQVGEHAVVLVGEAVPGRRPLDHDQPEQLAGVAHRGDSQLRAVPAVQQGGQPYRRPGAAGHPGPGDNGQLARRHAGGSAGRRRVPRPPARARRRCRCRPRRWSASSTCAATRPAEVAARPSGWLGSGGCRTSAAPRPAPPARRTPRAWPRPAGVPWPARNRPRRSRRPAWTGRAVPGRWRRPARCRPRAPRSCTRRRPGR